MLAAVMNRVLIIKWDKNHFLGVGFDDLFSDFHPPSNLVPVLFYDRNLTYHVRTRVVKVCSLTINQNNYEEMAFLFNVKLFARMDNECNVIRIVSNQFFGPATLSRNFAGSHNKKFRSAFQYPFRKFVSLTLKPKQPILIEAQKIIEQFNGLPWLSIHERGTYQN